MAKLSEMGPFRPTPGTAYTVSATGYASVRRSKGVAVEWKDGALRPTAPDSQTGSVGNSGAQNCGKIVHTRE